MKSEEYRALKVLEELSANPSLTQRGLSKKLKVALGLANLMISRLIKKGYVKVISIRRNRIRYFLTPSGITEKTRLSYEYLEYSLHLYRQARRLLTETLAKVVASGGRRVVFLGASEIAEIAYLTIKELGLELVGVADDQAIGQPFLGLTVLRVEDLSRITFDCGIISALNGDLGDLRQRLSQLGVPEERIIVLEHKGPRLSLISAPIAHEASYVAES